MESTISTHTPLAGRDRNLLSGPSWMSDFYSHAPRGARRFSTTAPVRITLFLLTRPSRGATPLHSSVSSIHSISTHTPLAGRDLTPFADVCQLLDFYSHAPRGARHVVEVVGSFGLRFLLTRPSRGATQAPTIGYYAMFISTHTPLAGRDFLPRLAQSIASKFLLTRPSRGATVLRCSACASI